MVSPTSIMRVAGENAKSPPLPTMTVRVRGPAGAVVVVTPPGVGGVVTGGHVSSQRLGASPMHMEPPFGGVHAVAFGFTEQVRLPFAVVREHVTKLGRPQVDCLAHFTTSGRQGFGRLPPLAAVLATRATHW